MIGDEQEDDDEGAGIDESLFQTLVVGGLLSPSLPLPLHPSIHPLSRSLCPPSLHKSHGNHAASCSPSHGITPLSTTQHADAPVRGADELPDSDEDDEDYTPP